MPITDITHDGKSWKFQMGKCVYRCDDYISLTEVKNQIIKEQFVTMAEYKKRIQEVRSK